MTGLDVNERRHCGMSRSAELGNRPPTPLAPLRQQSEQGIVVSECSTNGRLCGKAGGSAWQRPKTQSISRITPRSGIFAHPASTRNDWET
jgi:hypothetical protein